MKLIKIQYKKLEESMPIARKPAKVSKLQIHVCNALYNRELLQMEEISKRIWKVAHSLYEV